jgi:hypothetical protein
VFETSIQLHDELNLKAKLASLLYLDEGNVPTLKVPTTLLIRMNERQELEGYLKRLVVAELRSGRVADAQDDFNKLVIYGKNPDYLDMFHMLNQIVAGSDLAADQRYTTIVNFLETGIRYSAPVPTTGLALGVSELDLASTALEHEFVLEEAN